MDSALASGLAHMCTVPSDPGRSTTDNIGLSECRQEPMKCATAADTAADDLVSQYLDAARAPNTRRAYEWDMRDFEAWGGHVPSTADEIARYLAHRAASLRPSTLQRRLAALACAHRDRGLPDATKDPLVRRVLQGIERKHGSAVAQAAPLLIDHLARIVAVMGTSDRDLRDRAILLVGFFGALRRSEIVALDVSSLARMPGGLALLITRSKTDQVGRGRTVHLHARNDALCPVQALADWLSANEIRDGAVFRQVDARALERRLSDRAVTTIVKRWAAGAGLPTERFSGHSLRAGFATSAAMAGFDAIMIARQTGHHTQQALSAYVRPDPASIDLISSNSTDSTCSQSFERQACVGRQIGPRQGSSDSGISVGFCQEHNSTSLLAEQYALLRGVETPHTRNVIGRFDDALTHAVGEPVTYVQVSSEAKGHRDRGMRFSNSPITRARKAILRGRTSGSGPVRGTSCHCSLATFVARSRHRFV